jgi:hypothetical protein
VRVSWHGTKYNIFHERRKKAVKKFSFEAVAPVKKKANKRKERKENLSLTKCYGCVL